VDNATDALIHKTLRSAFGGSTVLTIAHRLHTIADVDRILVLEAGRVAEVGPPGVLMRTPGSAYRGLVEQAARWVGLGGWGWVGGWVGGWGW
jgi:ABC-type multidrug transport system fused ATPase/permease subunit